MEEGCERAHWGQLKAVSLVCQRSGLAGVRVRWYHCVVRHQPPQWGRWQWEILPLSQWWVTPI